MRNYIIPFILIMSLHESSFAQNTLYINYMPFNPAGGFYLMCNNWIPSNNDNSMPISITPFSGQKIYYWIDWDDEANAAGLQDVTLKKYSQSNTHTFPSGEKIEYGAVFSGNPTTATSATYYGLIYFRNY